MSGPASPLCTSPEQHNLLHWTAHYIAQWPISASAACRSFLLPSSFCLRLLLLPPVSLLSLSLLSSDADAEPSDGDSGAFTHSEL
jgi:hypothetical protein